MLRNNIKRLTVFILAFVLVASTPVFAAEYDQTFYSGNNILFYNPNAVCGAAPETVQSDIESGNAEENLQSLLEYFRGKGVTLAGAAGIAANVKTESGFNPRNIQNPAGDSPLAKKDSSGQVIPSSIFKPKDGQGYGLSQWTFGGTNGPRQGPLYNTAVRTKTDIGDLGLQLDYMWKELSSSYKTSTLDRIKNISDPKEATKIYMVNFEGPADQSAAAQNGRAADGQDIYNRYKGEISEGGGDTLDSSATTEPANNCNTTDDASGGLGLANGFTFPLKTTQAKIKNGIEGAVWCTTKKTNCHHDYNAADIFADTGTPIVAAKSGKVATKKTSSCDYYGCNVTIMGDDGVLYYYTHMSKVASVDKGQNVEAGAVIGTVGTNATAMNTPRHLHFDMLPGQKYKFRPGCSSAACNSYPFINVQEYLVPAFNALPKGGS